MITDRIDAITAIPHAYLRPDPPAPRSVKIELTGRCNYRCGFCALRTREVQPKTDMDMALFRKITVDMCCAGVEEIGLFYLGESFSAPELLLRAVEWVKREVNFPYVFLTTNGSLATQERARLLMDAGLDSLKFSVNAADEEQFEAVMGVKGKLFHEALENLQAARAIRDAGRYKCGIYASSIRYDGEQQEKMQAMLEREVLPYVDQHYWLPLYSMGSLATQREQELGYRPTAGNQGRLEAMREPLPCWSAFTEGHVTASGILSACCFDADSRWGMGDLNRDTFMAAWHSEAFKKLRRAHLLRNVAGSVCEECVAYA
ncbi:MAG: radical SAM protein [Sulfuricaulis sp.]|nr:radical SAM protein [Sulfuricaulis sp.]